MACTTILVGKDASYDGSTIIARNEDSANGEFCPKRFIVVKPDEQPRHYKSVLSHVEVDLPDEPLQYTAVPNADLKEGIWGEAGVNEANVAMSATETIAVNERVLAADPLVALQSADEANGKPETPGGIGEEDIITLVLPYVNTAREGVKRLAELLETYGTYESNGIIISDVDEIWYVETIGGHHWIARRVPDDKCAIIPNQLGIDYFDFDDAFSDAREFMCSADLQEFIETHHLGRAAGTQGGMNGGHCNPRIVFGTATAKDHIYNTPRAWYMYRYLDPADAENLTPESDDIPWCLEPENAVTVEDVDFLLGSHFEGTPYDPYGTQGTEESRHRYRPIGINRTGHMVAMQIRPYAPVESRSIMWISYGSGAFTTSAPFYANVDDTPAYLRDTTPEVSTDCLYWTNRLIATLADAHFYETSNAVEGFSEDVRSFGHRLVERRMMRLRLVGRRLGLVALVLVPVLRLAVLVLCLVLRLIPVPMGLLVLHLFRPVLRRLTTKWRNTCDRAIRSCSATCCTRPAISCTTVSPCRIAGTKPAGAFRVRFSRIGHTGIKMKRSCVRITRNGHRSA